MKITAAVAHEPGEPFSVEEIEIDSPNEDEVLIEIKGAGLCHTDLVAQEGAMGMGFPCVLGHEGSGVVLEVGSSVTTVAPGDHVAISFNSCGQCDMCESADPAYCRAFMGLNYSGLRLDGTTTLSKDGEEVASNFFGQSSLASHAIAYERNVVKVDPSLPIELLGPLGCGIQTGAGAVMVALDCESGSSLLVTGGGPVGLAAVMAAAARGLETIILSEPMEERRKLALDLGATHTIDPTGGKLDNQVFDIIDNGVNYAFDTTGIPAVLEGAFAALDMKGTLGWVGVPGDFDATLDINIMNAMVAGTSTRGIIEGDADPQTFIPELIELYQAGKLPLEKFTTTYPLSQINEAVAAQHAGEAVKVVLVP